MRAFALFFGLVALVLPGCRCDTVAPAGEGADADGDGFIDWADGGDDCDDADADVYPGAPEICDGADNDCDGLVDETITGVEGGLCDGDGDGWTGADDCDDANAEAYPGAPEVCDGVDNDCDGLVDESSAGNEGDLCDEDGDGWTGADDCDDGSPDVYPGAPEICDGLDNDCDGATDEGNDGNGDGIPDCQDGDGDGYSFDEGDCDDTDDAVFPGAFEVCDGIDNDCDTAIDEDTDVDADGIPDCSDLCPVYVDIARAAATQDGTWAFPFGSVQDGMDRAVQNACVYVDVYPGTYVETIDFGGHDLEVVAVGGRLTTTIDANGLGSVVTANSGETDAARIEGFTLTGGASGYGAGLDIVDSDLTVVGNDIVGNVASNCVPDGCGFGGGLRLLRSDSLVEDNIIQGNDAGLDGPENGSDGGGIAVVFGAPDIVGNTIVDNTAGDGGGIWLAKSDALVMQNVIAQNLARDQGVGQSGGQGGGINVQSASVGMVVRNNVVSDNEADAIGGGICVYEYNATYGNGDIVNNTIVWNSVGASGVGGGFAAWVNVAPDVRNNIVAYNGTSGVHTHATAVTYGIVYAYNDVYGNGSNWTGALAAGPATNVAQAASFVAASDDADWANDDFGLAIGSALVNAGDPAAAYNDADGSRNDIGAYGGPYGGW